MFSISAAVHRIRSGAIILISLPNECTYKSFKHTDVVGFYRQRFIRTG